MCLAASSSPSGLYSVTRGEVCVAVELAVPVVPGREGPYLAADAGEVLRLAGEGHAPGGELAVIERAYAQRVARGDEFVAGGVVYYAGELGVEHGEHICPVLAVHGQEYLAVGAGAEAVAHAHELGLERAEAVELAVCTRTYPRRGGRAASRWRRGPLWRGGGSPASRGRTR